MGVGVGFIDDTKQITFILRGESFLTVYYLMIFIRFFDIESRTSEFWGIALGIVIFFKNLSLGS